MLGFGALSQIAVFTGPGSIKMTSIPYSINSLLKESENASRANFADVTDFIGWYTTQSEKLVGISKNDFYNQYLAYHEGQGGWKKETYLDKKWLIEVAKTVERNAKMYNNQLKECEEKLNKKGFFGIF